MTLEEIFNLAYINPYPFEWAYYRDLDCVLTEIDQIMVLENKKQIDREKAISDAQEIIMTSMLGAACRLLIEFRITGTDFAKIQKSTEKACIGDTDMIDRLVGLLTATDDLHSFKDERVFKQELGKYVKKELHDPYAAKQIKKMDAVKTHEQFSRMKDAVLKSYIKKYCDYETPPFKKPEFYDKVYEREVSVEYKKILMCVLNAPDLAANYYKALTDYRKDRMESMLKMHTEDPFPDIIMHNEYRLYGESYIPYRLAKEREKLSEDRIIDIMSDFYLFVNTTIDSNAVKTWLDNFDKEFIDKETVDIEEDNDIE